MEETSKVLKHLQLPEFATFYLLEGRVKSRFIHSEAQTSGYAKGVSPSSVPGISSLRLLFELVEGKEYVGLNRTAITQ